MIKLFIILFVLLLPALANANSVAPTQKWLDKIKSEQPLYPFRLSRIEIVHGSELETKQERFPSAFRDEDLPVLIDYELALRLALKDSGYFDNTSQERVSLKILIEYFSEWEVKTTYTINKKECCPI